MATRKPITLEEHIMCNMRMLNHVRDYEKAANNDAAVADIDKSIDEMFNQLENLTNHNQCKKEER